MRRAMVACLFLSSLAPSPGRSQDPSTDREPERVRLVVESIDGPVSPSELDCYRRHILTIRLPENNHEKQLAWSTSRTMQSMAVVYRMTGDTWYLDRLIEMADSVLKMRNGSEDGDVDYVTGRRLPTWPNFSADYNVQGKPVYYSNVVQTGMIVYPIATAAKLMIEEEAARLSTAPVATGARKARLNQARTYLICCSETISAFVDHPEWFDSESRLFRYPTGARHEQVLPGAGGLPLPYNRMFAMGRAMLEVAESLRLLDESSNRDQIDHYYDVVRAMLAYFFDHVEVHGQGDEAYSTWMYRSFGKAGRPPRCEDVGHLGLDVRALLFFYREGESHLGIRPEDLGQIANTYVNVIHDSSSGEFSWLMDGTRQSDNPRRDELYFQRAIGLTPWEPRLFDLCAQSMARGAGPKSDLAFAEFLYWKDYLWRTASPKDPVTPSQ